MCHAQFQATPAAAVEILFFVWGFLGGSREFSSRRIWPIKVVFAPLRNAKQTFWKWKDFLLIPFHAHLLSSEVTMGPEEAAWGHQMDRGGAEEAGMRGGRGYSSYSDLVALSWSQHVRMGSGGGDLAARHLAWLLLFAYQIPGCLPTERATSVAFNSSS